MMITRETDLTAEEYARLDRILIALKQIHRYPGSESRIEEMRALVLWPSIDAWNLLHRTALNAQKTLSLWQAVCLTSPYPAVVPVDQNGIRYWLVAPESGALLTALEYALS